MNIKRIEQIEQYQFPQFTEDEHDCKELSEDGRTSNNDAEPEIMRDSQFVEVEHPTFG